MMLNKVINRWVKVFIENADLICLWFPLALL